MSNEIHVFIDTETTGLGHNAKPPREDAIVEIGMAWRERAYAPVITSQPNPEYRMQDNVLISQGWKVWPGRKYLDHGRADYALQINRLTIQELMRASSAIDVSGAVNILLSMLSDKGKVILHAYNIDFDRPFVEQEPWNLKYEWGEDPMVMFADTHNNGRYAKLDVALEYKGIWRKGKAHTAESDAIAAMELYEALIKERNQ